MSDPRKLRPVVSSVIGGSLPGVFQTSVAKSPHCSAQPVCPAPGLSEHQVKQLLHKCFLCIRNTAHSLTSPQIESTSFRKQFECGLCLFVFVQNYVIPPVERQQRKQPHFTVIFSVICICAQRKRKKSSSGRCSAFFLCDLRDTCKPVSLIVECIQNREPFSFPCSCTRLQTNTKALSVTK